VEVLGGMLEFRVVVSGERLVNKRGWGFKVVPPAPSHVILIKSRSNESEHKSL
jgi:hypothetical protein